MPWKVLPLTALPGLEQQPVLSPAGDHVAFFCVNATMKNHDIYVQQVSAGTSPAARHVRSGRGRVALLVSRRSSARVSSGPW